MIMVGREKKGFAEATFEVVPPSLALTFIQTLEQY
jgi:hypothetical protein